MSPRIESPPLQPGCPVCAAPLADGQAWCLSCGAAARTRIAPTPPRWRLIAVVLAIASVLAVVAIAVAIAKLVRPDSRSGVAPRASSAQPVGATPLGVTRPATPAAPGGAAPTVPAPAPTLVAPRATSPQIPARPQPTTTTTTGRP